VLTMESQLAHVNRREYESPDDANPFDQKVRLDLLLSQYYEDIYEAARIKSGLEHLIEGKKPTKYFSALVKHRGEKSAISGPTVKRDGIEVKLSHIEDILEEASSFYAEFYSCRLFVAERDLGSKYLEQNVCEKLADVQKDLRN
jgi:hypothetical protein